MKVLVMGAGISGLCAATDLADFDLEVNLIEATQVLGGRASSWVDPDGDTIDNALHVFMPHYCNALTFLNRVGAEPLHWTQGISTVDEQGRQGVLPIGGGLGTMLQAMKSETMSPLDQISLGAGIISSMVLSPGKLDEADEMSMQEWFRRHGATANAIRNFRPGGAGLTFLELNQVSAKALLYWISSFANKEYMSNPGIGFANGGLGEIYGQPARDYIEKRGGKVELGKAVKAIKVEGNRVTGVETADGGTITADAYVSALPYYELRRALPDSSLQYDYFLDIWNLDDAPSVSVQIWFDRFITEMKNIAFQLHGTFNCYADLHRMIPRFAEKATGSMIEFVLTPAFGTASLPSEFIYEKVMEELKRIMPEARQAEVTKWVVVKERQGIFAQRPGVDKFRPSQRSPYTNLYLCGDYTRTFISAGMENACASAHIAASHVLDQHLGIQQQLFSKPTYYNSYIKKGLGAGAVAAAAAAAAAVVRLAVKR